MIELYDPARLGRQVDRSFLLLGGAMVLVVLGLAAYAFKLQAGLQQVQSQTRELEARLQRAGTATTVNPTLLLDLRNEVQRLENEVAAAVIDESKGPGLSTAQWMERLAALGTGEVSLQRVEIDRSGAARIEGLATTTAALSAFVQSWERQGDLSALKPRSLEVRQDKAAGQVLRFQLRATPAGGKP